MFKKNVIQKLISEEFKFKIHPRNERQTVFFVVHPQQFDAVVGQALYSSVSTRMFIYKGNGEDGTAMRKQDRPARVPQCGPDQIKEVTRKRMA